MGLEKLISVSGKSGLYRLVGQMKNGIIVESLEDGKRFPVHGSAKVSALEEISIYTEDSEIPLKEVFDRIYEKTEGKTVLSHKEDSDKIKAFFSEMVPEHDSERVYMSDMVKVVKWYNTLIEHGDYTPEAEEEEKEGETSASEEGEAARETPAKSAKKPEPKKPASKSTPKKTASPKASSSAKGGGKSSTPRKAG